MTEWRGRVSTVALVLALLAVPEASRGEERGGEVPASTSRLEALAAQRPAIYVTDVNGIERTCVLVAVHAEGLRVAVPAGDLVVPWAEIDVVWRRGDPVWDGFLKGAAIGGGVNLLLVGGSLGDGVSRSGWVARAAVSWGLIGAVIDAMHIGRSPVFVAPTPRASWRHDTGAAHDRGLVLGVRIGF